MVNPMELLKNTTLGKIFLLKRTSLSMNGTQDQESHIPWHTIFFQIKLKMRLGDIEGFLVRKRMLQKPLL
jgi:hypothetical protein